MSDNPNELTANQLGAYITSGPADWQIIQRDENGQGCFDLRGYRVSQSSGKVEIRLVYEASGQPVNPSLDWHPVETHADGTWTASVKAIPSGGLYRLETRHHQEENPMAEWSERGDVRHFLGVGDLWVLAGQSNSAGYGRGPIFDPPELGVHMFRSSMEWGLASQPISDTTGTQHPVNRETANPGHSPYLHFAKTLKQHLGYPIGLVPVSLGGSPLSMWNLSDPEPSGALFHNMVRCVKAAGGKVKGMLWYQGESDASQGLAETYLERFKKAVATWRESLNNPTLPVITVQLNRYYAPPGEDVFGYMSVVREAQRQAARAIPGVYVVPTFDLPLSDGIHTSPAGNLVLGARMAQLALGIVYDNNTLCLPPDVQTATASPDRLAINLVFSPVVDRMDNINPTSSCFRVEDEQGVVPVEKVVYPGGEAITLALGRSLAGKTVVHGGYGVNPAVVPVDIQRMMPMLGFYGTEVTFSV